MDFKEIVFLTMSSIKERRTRTILTIIMITMGCGLLVSLNSLTQGLIYFVEQNFKNILPNQIIISNSDKIQQSYLQNLSGVNFVDPAYQGMVLLKNKDKSEITNVIAVNFSNLKNVIPNLDNTEQIKRAISTENKIIVIPQK